MKDFPLNSPQYKILEPSPSGTVVRLIVAMWRIFACLWAIVAAFFTTATIALPPVLFVLLPFHGQNPFQRKALIPLVGTVLGLVAFSMGMKAIQAYALWISPTKMVSVRYVTWRELACGLGFSILGAAAVYLMWRKPEQQLIYGAYVLFGIVVFPISHAFRSDV
jgi:hypothetical protein